jgi:hypothetical protein
MIKAKIALESYSELEKILKKFNRIEKNSLIIYDTENKIGDSKKCLQDYLMNFTSNMKISIIDVSSLPKDAKVCLFAYKDETL